MLQHAARRQRGCRGFSSHMLVEEGGGVPFTQSPQELMEALEEEAMALEIHVCVRAF